MAALTSRVLEVLAYTFLFVMAILHSAVYAAIWISLIITSRLSAVNAFSLTFQFFYTSFQLF